MTRHHSNDSSSAGRTLYLSAAVLLVSLGGCGGGPAGGESADGPQRLSKAELIAEGDELCAATGEELAPVFAELFPTGSETPPAEKAAGPMRVAATALREEHSRLSALSPPAADEAKFDAILDEFGEAVADIEQSADMAAAGDTEGYLKALERANGSDAESRELMRAYGFETCAGEE